MPNAFGIEHVSKGLPSALRGDSGALVASRARYGASRRVTNEHGRWAARAKASGDWAPYADEHHMALGRAAKKRQRVWLQANVSKDAAGLRQATGTLEPVHDVRQLGASFTGGKGKVPPGAKRNLRKAERNLTSGDISKSCAGPVLLGHTNVEKAAGDSTTGIRGGVSDRYVPPKLGARTDIAAIRGKLKPLKDAAVAAAKTK